MSLPGLLALNAMSVFNANLLIHWYLAPWFILLPRIPWKGYSYCDGLWWYTCRIRMRVLHVNLGTLEFRIVDRVGQLNDWNPYLGGRLDVNHLDSLL